MVHLKQTVILSMDGARLPFLLAYLSASLSFCICLLVNHTCMHFISRLSVHTGKYILLGKEDSSHENGVFGCSCCGKTAYNVLTEECCSPDQGVVARAGEICCNGELPVSRHYFTHYTGSNPEYSLRFTIIF